MKQHYLYNAVITNVVDGDTFDATVDLGFTVHVQVRFRLANIDTPEIYRPKSDEERERGHAATALVSDIIAGEEVVIESKKTGKYGRWLAIVHLPNGQTLAEVLKEAGFEKLK